jgi:hypothetical protein
MKVRYCTLGICPPTKIIFGKEYGVCPMSSPCPDEIACGYAMTRNIIEDERVTPAIPQRKRKPRK